MTLIGVAVGFSWLGVYTPNKWVTATAIYVLGCESSALSITRVFPQL